MALSTRRTQHRGPTHIGLPFATQSGEACQRLYRWGFGSISLMRRVLEGNFRLRPSHAFWRNAIGRADPRDHGWSNAVQPVKGCPPDSPDVAITLCRNPGLLGSG